MVQMKDLHFNSAIKLKNYSLKIHLQQVEIKLSPSSGDTSGLKDNYHSFLKHFDSPDSPGPKSGRSSPKSGRG